PSVLTALTNRAAERNNEAATAAREEAESEVVLDQRYTQGATGFIPVVGARTTGMNPVAPWPGRAGRERLMASTATKTRRLNVLAEKIRVCVECPLHESRTHAVPGDGKPTARVMLIGEGPGRDEDKSGHPFVGASGRFLNHVLEGTGISREDL